MYFVFIQIKIQYECMMKIDVGVLEFREESDFDNGFSRKCDFGNFLDLGLVPMRVHIAF